MPVSPVTVVTANTSAHEEQQTGGTFDQHINRKVTLPKLNNESSTNDQRIWLADVHHYIDSGCSVSILESEIDKSLSNGFWGGLVLNEPNAQRHCGGSS